MSPERPIRGVKPAIWASSTLVELISDLTDEGECFFDHHGYCQGHGWLQGGECPHARAKRFLACLDEADEP